MDEQEVASPLSDGRYRLRAELGRGGMATVWKAWDERLQVYRAIKELAPDLSRREKLRLRFLREARTLARLHHPNIVTIHDVGVDGDRVYMVMELLEGGTLMGRIEREGALPTDEAVSIAQAVLAALALAHAEGVVHRDIKPHNVLMSRTGTPKLGDFGIAALTREDRSLTKTGVVMGTWAYMAPEQRSNAKEVDHRSDVYAVGATLFMAVTGREPLDLYVSAAREEMYEGVDPALAQVIQKATEYRPEDRHPSAQALSAALAVATGRLAPAPAADRPLPGAAPPFIAAALADGSGTAAATLTAEALGTRPPPTAPVRKAAPRDGTIQPTTTPSVTRPPVARALVGIGAGLLLVGLLLVVLAVGSVGAWWALSSPDDVVVTAPADLPETPAIAAPVADPEPTADTPPPAPPILPLRTPLRGKVLRPQVREASSDDAVATGHLSVNSVPWSSVSIDGVPHQSTPLRAVELPAGTHELQLTTSDGRTTARPVTLEAGDKVTFCWDFNQDQPCSRSQ